jgi:geranylgeranyl pyrophosphate synthase
VVLSELRNALAPRLRAGYQDMITAWTAEHLPGLPEVTRAYVRYAAADRNMNRPLLALVGYGAQRSSLSSELYEQAGPLCLLPQLVRDFLAIHDDIVDGDTEKLGQPTLPASVGEGTALFTADLLLGMIGDLITDSPVPPAVQNQLHALVWQILRRTQRGQLTELALQLQPPGKIPIEALLGMYADKAAAYCYVFPFEVGTALAGTHDTLAVGVRPVLEDIGTASQIVDDLLGNCPGGSKETPGEVTQLRRTVLLAELARLLPGGDPLGEVVAGQYADPQQSDAIRNAFITTGAARRAAQHAGRLAARARAALADLPLGAPTAEYLNDLIDARITAHLHW